MKDKNENKPKNSVKNKSGDEKQTNKKASHNSNKQSNNKVKEKRSENKNIVKTKKASVGGKKDTNKKPKTINTLEQRNESKIKGLEKKAKRKIKPIESKKTSAKTQGLANKLKQANIKTVDKNKSTTKTKTSSNLNKLIGNKASRKSKQVEGIIKKTNKIVLPASDNTSSGFDANVVARKSKLKLVTSKVLVAITAVCFVLLLASLAFAFYIMQHYKFMAENPPYTITKTISMNLSENSASNFASITVPKNVIRGLELLQKVTVETKVLQTDQAVRCKTFFTTNAGDVLTHNVVFDDDWILHDDGYAYYTKLVKSGQKINAITSVQVPHNFEKDINSKFQHIITINFETISAESDLLHSFWQTAPDDFIIKD